jgi:hypothetical protein
LRGSGVLMAIMAVPALLVGLLRIAAGLANFRYRRRTLGMTAAIGRTGQRPHLLLRSDCHGTGRVWAGGLSQRIGDRRLRAWRPRQKLHGGPGRLPAGTLKARRHDSAASVLPDTYPVYSLHPVLRNGAALQAARHEKLCRLHSGVILGKAYHRYSMWPNTIAATPVLRLERRVAFSRVTLYASVRRLYPQPPRPPWRTWPTALAAAGLTPPPHLRSIPRARQDRLGRAAEEGANDAGSVETP